MVFSAKRVRAVQFLLGAFCSCVAAAAAIRPASEPSRPTSPNEIPPALLSQDMPPSEATERLGEVEAMLEPTRSQLCTGPCVRLTPAGKFTLALRNWSDPFTILTAVGDAGVGAAIASPKSAYGTGWMGFGKRFGTDMTDELNGEFFQTFFFPSIFHQNPHYQRLPGLPTSKRIVYALSRVLISRSDSGKPMPNYGELLGNVASASITNLYHEDREHGVIPTTQRIGVSIASDSAWNLFTEFWPDVAPHIHIRMVLLRRLAERAAKPN